MARRKSSAENSVKVGLQVQQTKNERTVYSPFKFSVSDLKRGLMVQISNLIESRGWTQSQAASAFSVTQSRISDLVRAKDEMFSLDMLIKWAAHLGCNVQILLDGQDINPPASGIASGLSAEARVAFFSKALVKDPDNFIVLAERAFAYNDLGKFDEAIADLKSVLKLDPDGPGPIFNLSWAYFRADRFDECLAHCDIMTQAHPDYLFGWKLRGSVFEKLGKLNEALENYSRAINLDPEIAGNCYLERGKLYERLGKHDLAAADYTKLLQLRPQFEPALEALAELNQN
ncbi:MAG: tetratricopeptide repeat protein [Candidatus Obscuribacterales bacterium]|nr:tetratricopeptide repeat protein [Candidatus Obscuribacterales bacterium]